MTSRSHIGVVTFWICLSSSLDGRLSTLLSFNFDENRLSKVNAMPSFDVNVLTSSTFFKQSFKLPTFCRSSAFSRIERRQCRKSTILIRAKASTTVSKVVGSTPAESYQRTCYWKCYYHCNATLLVVLSD